MAAIAVLSLEDLFGLIRAKVAPNGEEAAKNQILQLSLEGIKKRELLFFKFLRHSSISCALCIFADAKTSKEFEISF